MKRYVIRVNCGCFEDIEVFANSEAEANEEAEKQFTCWGDSPEATEIIEQGARK